MELRNGIWKGWNRIGRRWGRVVAALALATGLAACSDDVSDADDAFDRIAAEAESQGGLAVRVVPGRDTELVLANAASPIDGTRVFVPASALPSSFEDGVLIAVPSEETVSSASFDGAGPAADLSLLRLPAETGVSLVADAQAALPYDADVTRTGDLAVARQVGGGWQLLAGTTLQSNQGRVQANTRNFSAFAAVLLAAPAPGPACTDADGDGFGAQCDAGPDCDDADDSVYREVDAFTDADGDGATVGEAVEACIGDTYPEGLTVAASDDPDCDDSDADAFTAIDLFVDADGDGVSVGGAVASCIGDTVPGGFVAGQSAVDDCDDADDALFTPLTGFVDADGDGHSTAESEQLCTDGDLPGGYLAAESDPVDCDDGEAEIHPDAEDTPGDGIDQDCDGLDDLPEAEDGVFVSAARGDDANPGSMTMPVSSVTQAVALAALAVTPAVFIEQGVYTGYVSTTVDLFGGYANEFTERVPASYVTEIRIPWQQAGWAVGIEVLAGADVRIDGLAVTSAAAITAPVAAVRNWGRAWLHGVTVGAWSEATAMSVVNTTDATLHLMAGSVSRTSSMGGMAVAVTNDGSAHVSATSLWSVAGPVGATGVHSRGWLTVADTSVEAVTALAGAAAGVRNHMGTVRLDGVWIGGVYGWSEAIGLFGYGGTHTVVDAEIEDPVAGGGPARGIEAVAPWGGAVTLSVEDTHVHAGVAPASTTAIAVAGGGTADVDLVAAWLWGGEADGDANGLYVRAATAYVDVADSSVRAGQAGGRSAGLRFGWGATATVSGSNVHGGNSVSGSTALVHAGTGQLTAWSNDLYGGWATGAGALAVGLHAAAGTAVAVNNFIAGGIAEDGDAAGIMATTSGTVLAHNTVFGGYATGTTAHRAAAVRYAVDWADGTPDLTLLNNILDGGSGPATEAVILAVTHSADGIALYSNVLTGTEPAWLFFAAPAATAVTDIAELNDCLGGPFAPYCEDTAGNISADPGVRDIRLVLDVGFSGPSGDPHLEAPGTSPAVDAGTDPGTIGLVVDDDYDGDPRPLDAGFDIGADEAGLP